MPAMQVRLLGHFRLIAGDEIKRFSTKKAESLFAYLLLHRGKPVSRSTLATMLWPDAIEPRAKKNLNTTLWRVKGALAGESEISLSATEFGLAIHPNHADVDLFAFRTLLASSEGMRGREKLDVLTRAESLYAGEFMEGFSDDWCEEERRYARSQYVGLLKKLVDISKEERDYDGGVAYAQRVLTLDPLDEDTHRDLMLFWYLLGNRTGALRQYETLRKTLRDELGVEPTSETTELWGQFRTHTDAISLPRIAQLPKPAREASDGFEPVPMVGREDTLRWFVRELDDARAGRGKAVILSGDPGVGKSRLVETLAVEADLRGFEVLSGKSQDLNDPPPYQVFIQAFWPRLMQFQHGQGVTSPLANLIAALAPDAAQGDFGQTHAGEHLLNNAIVTEALLGLLAETRNVRPILLILEDLHRIDRASADLLTTLVERIPKSHILLVMTTREVELLVSRGDLLSRLVSLGVARLNIESLTEENTKRLIRAALRSKNIALLVVQQIWQQTAGNPLFVLEFLQLLCAESKLCKDRLGHWSFKEGFSWPKIPKLPVRVQAIVRRRIDILDAYGRKTLILAALLGIDFELGMLRELARPWGKWLMKGIERLVRDHLLEETSTGFRFSHESIRAVALTLPGKAMKCLLHFRVAALIERDSPWRTEDLAWHLEAAGDYKKALAYAEASGDKARLVHANENAVDWYTHAFGILEQVWTNYSKELLRNQYVLLAKRQESLDVLGDRLRQLQDIDSMHSIGMTLDDRVMQAKALALRATLLVRLNQAEKAIEAATKSRELFSSLNDYHGQAQSFLTVGLAFQSLRLYKQACESIQGALDLYDLVGDSSERAIALTHHGIVLTYLSSYKEALKFLDRAEDLLRGTEDPRAKAVVFVQRGIVLRLLGKPRTAESLIINGVKIFKQVGDRVGEARSLIQLAVTQVAVGHFRMAVWNGRRAIRLARQARDIRAQIAILAGLGDEVYRSIGDFSRAGRCIEESMRLIEESNQKENLAMYQDSMAGILLGEGRVEDALRLSKLSLMSCESGEVGTGQLAEVQYRLGCISSEMGNWLEATDYLHQALMKHIRFREIPYQIRTIVALSQVYFRQGNYSTALRYSRRALRLLRECEDHEQAPMTYWNHYQSLKATCENLESDKFLRQAHESLMRQLGLLRGPMKVRFAVGIRINREILEAAKTLKGGEESFFPRFVEAYAQAGPESTL